MTLSQQEFAREILKWIIPKLELESKEMIFILMDIIADMEEDE